MRNVRVESGMLLTDFLVAQGLADSKSSARRLIEEGAVRNIETDEKILDLHAKIDKPIVLKIGKKSFVRIKI